RRSETFVFGGDSGDTCACGALSWAMAGASEESKGVEALKNFERALGHVRNSVRPLSLMSREEVGGYVSAKDRATLNLQASNLPRGHRTFSRGLRSLFYMFLKTQGVSPSTHPVKSELDRIRGYFGRLKNVGKPPEQRTLKVDQDASRRFINAALSGDSVWQNAKGTDPKSAQEKRASAGIGRANPAGQPEDLSAQAGGAAAGAEAGAEAPENTALPVDGGTGQQPWPQSSKSGRRNGKRKLTAGISAGAAVVAGATRAGAGAGKKRRSGGGGTNASSRDGPAEARSGEGPEAAVPGESTPGSGKPKGKAGKSKKKSSRHNAW
ncbi:unnamed protein product, partial [Ectocarpus fasciculatus]